MQKTLTGILAAILLFSAIPAEAAAGQFSTPNVTRAEAAMLILQTRLSTVPDVRDTKQFPDVVPGAWYERYIVLAERYGILDADPTTKRIRPDAPVTRAEFLRMLTFAFGLPEGLTEPYRDVTAATPGAVYAGLASAYALFPADKDKGLLHPGNELTHGESAQAVWILSQALIRQSASTTEGRALAQAQATYNLRIYQKISTMLDRVTVVPGMPMHAAASSMKGPRLTAPVMPVVVRAGDDATQLPQLRNAVLTLVNAERTKAGVPLLRVSPTLEASAQIYAESMATRGFFGHVSPEGKTLRDRMEASGYYRPEHATQCPTCTERYELGENLGQGQLTPAEVVRDWMNSSTHRAALLSPAFSETGFGISAGIWVEHFGGRK